MAEGGLTSIDYGSDAYTDILCTPCGQGNIREEAVKYCPECQEHLCTACTIHHGRQTITRSHKLQAGSTTKKGSMVAMTEKCRYHPDRNIEMYCEAHDMVYCAKCIAKEHRSCHGVIDVEDVKLPASTKSEIQRLHTDMKNLQDRLLHIDKTTQTNIVSLEKQKSTIAKKIEEVEQKLIEHIRQLKQEAMNNLKKEHYEVKNELQSFVSDVGERIREIEKSCKKMVSLLNMDARQQFIHIKLIQNTLHDAGKILAEGDAKGNTKLCFTENSSLKSSIILSTSLGRVQTDPEREQQIIQKSYKVKSKKKINVKMKNDHFTCKITDMCQLPDGTMILADMSNQKIKRLDMKYNIKDHCDLDARPFGICCTGQNEVAVKMGNKVQFISVGSSLSKLSMISIEGGGYNGIAYCDGELWITSTSCVNVYSASGTLLKTTSKYTNRQSIFSSFQYMAISGDTVIIPDDGNGAVCLRRDGTVRGELRDDRLVNTRGVCVSGEGTVFLAGYLSANVVMFDKNGKCLGELVAKDAILFDLVSLYYDDNRNRLIVTRESSDKIRIFYLSG